MGKTNKEANHPSWHLSRWSEQYRPAPIPTTLVQQYAQSPSPANTSGPVGRVTVKNHHSNSSIEFECTDTSRILIPLCCLQRSLAAASHATITRVWCNAYTHLHKHVQTSLWDNLVNILETQCPMTLIVLLGLAIMAPLASNQALLESNQVLGTA
jgi:hypothetical protein